jgi:PST family polysaccharide transporter
MNQAWIQLLPPILRSKLHGRYTLQKILSNTGWLFADRILRMGVGLIVGVWVARYLGPEQFGLFNYAIAFVSLLMPLATLGLDGIVVRDLVRDPTCKDVTLGTTFVLKLLGAVVTIFITIGAIVLIRPGSHQDHWLVGIVAAGMLFQAFDTIDFWFQSQVQSKYTVYARNLAFVLLALVKVALIQVHAPLIAFVWAGLAETAIGTVGLVIAFHAAGNHLKNWKITLVRAKTLLRDSWALILSGVAIMIYMKIDQIMLGEMVGDHAVGIYSAATPPFRSLVLYSNSNCSFCFPCNY